MKTIIQSETQHGHNLELEHLAFSEGKVSYFLDRKNKRVYTMYCGDKLNFNKVQFKFGIKEEDKKEWWTMNSQIKLSSFKNIFQEL